MNLRLALFAALLVGLLSLSVAAHAETYFDPTTGRLVQCDPSELVDRHGAAPWVHRPHDWAKFGRRARVNLRDAGGGVPREPTGQEIADDEKTGKANGRIARAIAARRWLADLQALRVDMVAAGKRLARIDALIATADGDATAKFKALPAP